MRLYVSCLLFAALQLTLIPICSHSAANTKDLTSWQKEIEKIVNTSTAAGDISVKLGIDPDCNPLSQDEILCQWDDYHLETNFPVKVFCSLYVNPSRKKIKWDAQDSCRIYSPFPLSSSSKDKTEHFATRKREIEEIVDASTSAGDLSVKLGINPDCDPLSPDEFLCQWDDYNDEMRSYINVFCFMFVNQSHKKVIWDAQDCRIYSPLSLSSSSKDNAENLATRRREIEKIVDASTSAGNLSMRLGIAPDCNPLIPDQPLDQILCQWYDYHAKGATISVFCFMLLNKSRTEAIWNAQDQCRIYAPLPPEPKPK
jgi:hypothetical protein